MGMPYDEAVDWMDNEQLEEREGHLAEEEEVCQNCAGWGAQSSQNDEACDCEYEPDEVIRGGQCPWCDVGDDCEAEESGYQCPYEGDEESNEADAMRSAKIGNDSASFMDLMDDRDRAISQGRDLREHYDMSGERND